MSVDQEDLLHELARLMASFCKRPAEHQDYDAARDVLTTLKHHEGSALNRLAASSPKGAALPEGVPAEILAIAQRLHTQDNRITQDPLFAVQQKRRIYGVDADYCDNAEWVLDGETWTPEDGEDPPENARKVGYIDKWEFVTGCLTEQGCRDFIAINGHNLHKPRIYAYGSYRNAEFIALRKWLMSLVPQESA